MGQHATSPDQFLPQRLSQGRLAPYVAAAGSMAAAIDLYSWNLTASGAVYESLHVTEVVLRNAMHDALAAAHQADGHTGSWMDDPHRLLTQEHRDDIAKARSRARRKAAPTEGHVVAELNWGFWRFLLARRYQATLWRTAIADAFPHLQPKTRSKVEEPVIRLHKLRNRVAHLEPLLREDLLARRQDMLTVIGYICPDTRDWLDQRCRIQAVAAARP